MQLFMERGYDGTSVADLVGAMGIAPPSLYAAFGSKEALYQEVLRLYLEGRGRYVSRSLEQDLPVREQVRLILESAAREFTPGRDQWPGCMVAQSMLACSPANQQVAEHVKALRAIPVKLVQDRMTQAQVRGELPAEADPRALSRFYAAVVTGMAVQARDGASRKDLLQIADDAMRAWPQASGVPSAR